MDGVTFDVKQRECLGIVGESGSGKTMSALSIVGLVPDPGRIVSGRIEMTGVGGLLEKSKEEMRRIRGDKIAMSFQDPMTFLNPVFRVGDQISEAILLHQSVSKSQAWQQAVESMRLAGISSPETRAKDYPHQLSGGMRQRILLAIALSCNPDLLIADEPTTALDVIVQAEILDLLKDLKEKVGSSVMIISHDLGVVAELADRVVIMYAGKVVEMGETTEVYKNPLNPYTKALLESIPQVKRGKRRLVTIDGVPPDAANFPAGCRFHPRCSACKKICGEEEPHLIEAERGHWTACHMES